MMNEIDKRYIDRLHDDCHSLQEQLAAAQARIAELESYGANQLDGRLQDAAIIDELSAKVAILTTDNEVLRAQAQQAAPEAGEVETKFVCMPAVSGVVPLTQLIAPFDVSYPWRIAYEQFIVDCDHGSYWYARLERRVTPAPAQEAE